MIHQPEFLPWTNLFTKVFYSDVFVFLDNVQYARRSFQNRNVIKTRTGERWLTVPLKKSPRDEKIQNIRIDNTKDWKNQHLRLIADSYKKAPYYNQFINILESGYEKEWDKLSDLNCWLTKQIIKFMGLKVDFVRSSQLNSEGSKLDLILNICQELKAKKYISGIGAQGYLSEVSFSKKQIKIIYIPPVTLSYQQQFSDKSFTPNLSIIDFLFNNKVDCFQEIIKQDTTLNKNRI